MSSYVLSCCSTADLSLEHFQKRDIHYVCFHFKLGDKTYPDDLGQSISFPEFYQEMVNGKDTSTSQINISEYVDYFEGFLKEGKDVLHLALSSGISGTINSARNAANICMERYPDRKVIIVDSLCASSGFGLIMDKLADLRDEGMDLETLAQWAEDNKQKLQHWFFSTDLTFFIKGGRVSKASGVVAGILDICPLLHVDAEGRLIPMEKVRTKKKVKLAMLKRMKALADDGIEYADKVYISNSACEEDAKDVAKLIEETFPKMKGKVEIFSIGTVIGSHTGPGTVALFFWGKKRNEE